MVNGDAGADVMNGYEGVELLFGDLGNDTITPKKGVSCGGTGDNLISLLSDTPAAAFDGGDGYDRTNVSAEATAINLDMSGPVIMLNGVVLTGIEQAGIDGSDFADEIIGGAGNDFLDGSGGAPPVVFVAFQPGCTLQPEDIQVT